MTLETVIEEAGHECIFLPKFYCKLNSIKMASLFFINIIYLMGLQYWRWVKYHYHQVPKPKFEDAKKAAFDTLNACPVNVIQHFINHSWRFMGAYRIGLTRKAAA